MTLYRAMNAAPGSSVRPPVEKQDSGPVHIGPAHARMHSLAVARQRARSISYAHAYTEAYLDPANESVKRAVEAEHQADRCAGETGKE